MNLSLNLNFTEQQNNQEEFEIGTFVSGKIITKNEADLVLQINDRDVECILPMHHLSDHVQNFKQLFETYSEGDEIKNCLIIDVMGKRKVVTLKPALIISQLNGRFPNNMDQIITHQLCVGYVTGIEKYGVFVKYANKLTALAPTSASNESIVPGATVYSRIIKVDQKNKKMTVTIDGDSLFSLNNKLEILDDDYKLSFSSSVYLRTLLAEREKLSTKKTSTLKVGQIIDGTVIESKKKFIKIKLDDVNNLKGVCLKENLADSDEVMVNDSIKVKIIDIVKNKVYVSNKFLIEEEENVIEDLDFIKEQQKFKKNSDTEYNVTILLIQPNYMVCSIAEDDNKLCYVSTGSYNGPMKLNNKYEIGESYKAIECQDFNQKLHFGLYKTFPNMKVLTFLEDSENNNSGKRKRARSLSLDLDADTIGTKKQKVDAEVGNIVQGIVKNITNRSMLVSLMRLNDPKYKKYKAEVYITDANDIDIKVDEDSPGKNKGFSIYAIGDAIQGKIYKIDHKKKMIHLTIRSSELQNGIGKDTLAERITFKNTDFLQDMDKIYYGFVDEITKDGIFVSLSKKCRGFVYSTNISEDLQVLEDLFNGNSGSIKVGNCVGVKVLSQKKKKLHFTMIF